MWNLKNKKALITGGTKGIGLATANMFRELGAEVITVSRNAGDVRADIATPEGCSHLLEFVQKRWDTLNILVNNAGFNTRKPTLDYSGDEIKNIFDTNLISAFELSRLFFPMLRNAKNACITNVASIAGLAHLRSGSVYAMTKAAMIQLTRNLAVEWAPHGIRVNAVAPGFTETPMTQYWKQHPEILNQMHAKTPLGRSGSPQEIAAAIAFTAMPAASFMTGQCLVVDGGFTINAG